MCILASSMVGTAITNPGVWGRDVELWPRNSVGPCTNDDDVVDWGPCVVTLVPGL